MRFAELFTRTLSAGALAAALLAQGGCAWWPGLAPTAEPAPPPAPVVVASPLPAQPAPPPGAALSAGLSAAPAAAPVVAAEPASPVPAEPTRPPIPTATQAEFDEAVRALRAGRVPEAKRALLALAAQHPELAGVHANLGLVHRKEGRLDESAAALSEAVRLAPRVAAFHNELGVTWRTLGRFDHARKAYETAIDLDPANAAALINLAILHDLYLGEPAAAAQLYTRGAALLPADAATINKWLAELKNRKAEPRLAAGAGAPRREQP